ncbi:MAG: ChbG/HpnK family deacetylase [Pseudomonadota bacterium]
MISGVLKPLIVTADDFAQSADIDAGIIALILKNRVSATSCLTMSPRWPEASRLLTNEIRGLADIGLHLDFTQYAGYRHRLPIVMARAFLNALPKKKILASINQQLDRFEAKLGTRPDYVDGHQHVHQLPQVREALLQVLVKRYGNDLPWLRIARPLKQDGFKGKVIAALGADALERQAMDVGIKCTRHLLGVYGFDTSAAGYLARLDDWLSVAADSGKAGLNGIHALMCHPATANDRNAPQEDDPIHAARAYEYEVLDGDGFGELLARHQLKVSRGNVLS